MATTLRELIAKVVFKADASQLKDFDQQLAAAKQRLVELDALAARGIHFNVGGTGGSRLLDLEGMLASAATAGGGAAQGVAAVGAAAKAAVPPAGELGATLGGLYRTFGGLGAAALAYKMLNWGTGLVSEAKHVGDLASTLGISTDALQTWTAFANRAGASNEDLTGTVKNLSKNIADAATTADGPAAKAFRKLGVSTAGWSKGLPPTLDVLLEAGGALSTLGNDTERLALAQALLGESALKLLPGFKGGTEEAKKQLAALAELAIIYDADFIQKSKEASVEMDLFEGQLKKASVEILVEVLPALREFVRWLGPLIKDTAKLLKNSHFLSVVFGVLGSTQLPKLALKVEGLITKFGGLTAVLKRAGMFVLRFVLPFLVLDDLITFLTGGESVIGDIINAMMGAGAAAKVVEMLHQAWQLTEGAVESLWDTCKVLIDSMLEVGDQGEESAQRTESAFLKASEGIGKAFDGLFDTLKTIWDDMTGLSEELRPKTMAEARAIEQGIIQPRKLGENRDPRFQEGGELYGEHGEGAFANPEAEALKNDFHNMIKAPGYTANINNGLGLGGNPAVPRQGTTVVNVNDNSSITSNINGVDASNVGPGLRQSEANIKAQLTRSKAQVLKQVRGATRD